MTLKICFFFVLFLFFAYKCFMPVKLQCMREDKGFASPEVALAKFSPHLQCFVCFEVINTQKTLFLFSMSHKYIINDS